MRESIKLTHAALADKDGEIVLRGVLDPASLHLIQADDYQREVLPLSSLNSLIEAFSSNTSHIPDVSLGMRGGGYLDREGAFYLQDPVYVIDGLQRISAALYVLRSGKNTCPSLGATVYFNTTKEMERDLFRTLNVNRNRLSPNILIRNLRETNTAVEMLYNLCRDKSFVLYDRICWQQRMRRSELLTALMLLKLCGILHSTWGPGLSTKLQEAAASQQKTMTMVGRTTMRDNIKTLFEVIDGAWGIRSVAFREAASYLRGSFLMAVGYVMAHHRNFWDDNKRLVVSPDMRRKLATFPVNDPQVASLSSASGTARNLLYQLLVNHLNSGKRTRRLRPFKEADTLSMAVEPEEEPTGEEDAV
jgi:hypothetical protein